MKVLKVKQNSRQKRVFNKEYKIIIYIEDNTDLTLEQEAKIKAFFESL